MDIQNITKLIETLVVRLQDGNNVETNKIEVKKRWYNLSKTDNVGRRENESEFLKDIAGLANTSGENGYLIIGIDGRTGELVDAPFKDSRLKDISDVRQLIVKSIDPPFDIELQEVEFRSQTLSVIEIINSTNKPHVIKNYMTSGGYEDQNYIPIRKNTGTWPASRNDIEMMYHERGIFKTEQGIRIISDSENFGIVNHTSGHLEITGQIALENYGTKSTAVVQCALRIHADSQIGISSDILLQLKDYGSSIYDERRFSLKQRFLIIPSDQIITVWAMFHKSIAVSYLDIIRQQNWKYSFEIKDSSGRVYNSVISERH